MASVIIHTVVPCMVGRSQAGWSVLRDGVPVNWFPDCTRALNEARHLNAAEKLRLEAAKKNGKVGA